MTTILYCGTHALMAELRVDQVIEFQGLFLDRMRGSHQDLLDALAAGQMPEEAPQVFEQEAADLCRLMTQKA